MPSTLRNTQQRALTFSRSLANAVKSKLLVHFFSSHQPTSSILHSPPPFPRRAEVIGRPRNLRRPRLTSSSHHRPHFIHHLPVEILAHIFVLGSYEDTFLPVAVSHVSRAWRQIALHTPSLWRRVNLSPKERMWRERIKRARACSLDVQLLPTKARSRSEPRHAVLDPYSIQWHMHIVLPYIDKWRSLEIAFPEFAPYLWKAALSRCCTKSGAQAPAIQDLRLVYRENDDPEEFTLFSGYAPRLESATLCGIKLTWLPSLFANLTFLDYTHHGFSTGSQAVQDILDILSVSCLLVHLRLSFPRKRANYPPSRMEFPRKRAVLLYLKSLHFRVEGKDIPSELARLATLLVTPSLTSLQLIDLSRSYHSFASLKSFFYVYALPPSLLTLRIENGWYDPRMITPITQSLARVRRIIIKRPHAAEQVLNLKQPLQIRKVPNWNLGHGHTLHNNSCQLRSLDVQYLTKTM